MDKLESTTTELIALAAKTAKRSKHTTREIMVSWIASLTGDNKIHHKDFARFSRMAINFLVIPSYDITKDENKWFVEDIIRAAYSHAIGDKETVEEWIENTNKAYIMWESKDDSSNNE